MRLKSVPGLAPLLAATVLACAPLHAMADLYAASSLTNMRFSVLDLRPDDGVAASVTMPADANDMSSFPGSAAFANTWIKTYDGQSAEDSHHAQSTLDNVSAQSSIGAHQALATVTGATSLDGPMNFVTSSQLIDPPSGDVGSWTPTQIAAQVANNENTKASLLLSPHTRLTLSGAADVFFSTTGRLSSSGDQHSLQASFLVLLSAAPGGKQQLEAASQDMWIPVEPSPDSSSYHEDLALSITNDSDEATSVGFWFRVASYAAAPHYALPQPPIPAIPEPAAGPLMLLGVGAVLKLARRR